MKTLLEIRYSRHKTPLRFVEPGCLRHISVCQESPCVQRLLPKRVGVKIPWDFMIPGNNYKPQEKMTLWILNEEWSEFHVLVKILTLTFRCANTNTMMLSFHSDFLSMWPNGSMICSKAKIFFKIKSVSANLYKKIQALFYTQGKIKM